MESRNLRIPSHAIETVSYKGEQQKALKKFVEAAQAKPSQPSNDPEVVSSPQGAHDLYVHFGQRLQLNVVATELENMVQSGTMSVLEVDTANIFAKFKINIRSAYPLTRSEREVALEEGRQEGNERFFSLLQTEALFSTGKVSPPFLRWTRSVAKQYLGLTPSDTNGESYVSLPTCIPGVHVGFRYAEGVDTPTREVLFIP